jgi:hypothetical protein
MTIDIDEQSPTLSFEARNPANPTQVVVDTSDSESPVAGGRIEIAPQGTSSWTTLPTSFTSRGQLIATIPDAGLSGRYTIQATACSQVGNCGSTSETLTMPLRLAARSDASFAAIVDPLVAKKVKERVRVGWHWAAVLRHGKAVKVKRGGHWKTITVIKKVEACTRKRVKTSRHHWKLETHCRAPRTVLRGTDRVAYGQSVTVNGLLVTSQDVPIANTPVQILTAPNNGLGQYTQAASVTTSADGAWSAALPAGPSRLIEAVYGGSATLLPATGRATVTVPASLKIKIAPRIAPWGSESASPAGSSEATCRPTRRYCGSTSASDGSDTSKACPRSLQMNLPDRLDQRRPRRDPPVVLGRHALRGRVPVRPRELQKGDRHARRAHPGGGEATPPSRHEAAPPCHQTSQGRAPPPRAQEAGKEAMIARHRGDLRAHTRWRPSVQAAVRGTTEPEQGADLQPAAFAGDGPKARHGRRLLLAVVTVIALAVIAGQQHGGRTPITARLPATPRQWVDQWTTASLENPARVCQQLYAPALASAFKTDTGRSCTRYYATVTSTSFRVRHVLQDGGTAVVEAHQVGARHNWGYFTMVLSRVKDGWQAVDVVPGGPVLPR